MAASPSSPEGEKARLGQALEDLYACGGVSVSLVHCDSRRREQSLARDLTAQARKQHFVTATVSLQEAGLETPDELVRDVLNQLVHPSESRACGLVWLLDDFWQRHRKNAAESFGKAVASLDAAGDLAALCQGYLQGAPDGTDSPLKAYDAWFEGIEPAAKHRNDGVRHTLSERTAQRALNDLTRMVRALGHRGLLLVLTEGDSLAERTPRQREKAYTVLRELVDNFDTEGGAISTRVIITGGDALFEGKHSLQSLPPLRMRLEIPSDAAPAPPHRSWTTLDASAPARTRSASAANSRGRQLRNLIRVSEGVPPEDGVTQMSVGQERLDRTIRSLFKVVERAGAFFSVLVGDYGSGKTHVMMHLAERALEDNRPVFWLNLERANLDLGNPPRHFGRLLSHSQVPLRGRPSALEVATRWTRSGARLKALREALTSVAEGEDHAAHAARRALRVADEDADAGAALEAYLTGVDLHDRPGDRSARLEAYRRLHLWTALLERMEEVRGAVVLIDEAENLYSSGLSPAQRRTALRSLSFYCGGSLPRACVIMAMTPPAFEDLKSEARQLLEEANHIDSTLDVEDVARFRRALWGLKPDPIRPLTRAERAELCDRVVRMHRSVRGRVTLPDMDAHLKAQVARHASPRTLIRALVDELEAAWWSGK